MALAALSGPVWIKSINMKSITFFAIMLCSAFLLLSSCDKSPDQFSKQNSPGNEQIAFRDPPDECTDCPNGCCCCNIEALNLPGTAILSICGVCEGDYLCGTYSPPSPCSSVSGQAYDLTFTSFVTRRSFCVPEGGSFRIYNNATFDVTIRFTCQHDEIMPDTHQVTIPANGGSVFFISDGECFLQGPCQ